ncbi:MAG: hypothetical protein AAFY46_01740, partial [Planctomycetota bacterium]
MLALWHITMLVAGIALLVVGAEVLVKGAKRLATAIGISPFVVGLTVVAFGTSAPELGGSIGAVFKDSPGLAVGNVIGSNIANIGLILGLTAIVCPIPVRLSVIRKEAIIMIVATVGAVALMVDGAHRVEGGVLSSALLGFIAFAYINGKRSADGEEASELVRAAQELDDELGSTEANAGLTRSIV